MELKNYKESNFDTNDISHMESQCPSCQEMGELNMLQTKIPFFKEVIVMGFNCPHCGYKNSEVEPAQELADQGIRFVLNVVNSRDMNRKIIKTNFASLNIPCCGLEIPNTAQKGKLSTIEGFISTAKEQFSTCLEEGYYSEMGDEFIKKIKELVQKLDDTLNGKMFPFELILDDPSGNSFIENPFAPQTDQNIKITFYDRTKEMCEAMGYSYENQLMENENLKEEKKDEEKDKNNLVFESKGIPKSQKEADKISYYNKKKDFTVYKSNNEISKILIDFTQGVNDNEEINDKIFSFPESCNCCGKIGEYRNYLCTIPYFKELLISCFTCEYCGYKSTDIKGGGGISEKATKLTLKVTSKEDLNRDIFKSDSAKVSLPDIGFETVEGSMGSMFTTVEGILDKIIITLEDTPFGTGDSRGNDDIKNYIEKVKELKEVKKEFTLILDDPLSNSFIFPLGNVKPEDDKNLIKEEYERTFEQNEELGINDMKTENYEEEVNKDNEGNKENKEKNDKNDEEKK